MLAIQTEKIQTKGIIGSGESGHYPEAVTSVVRAECGHDRLHAITSSLFWLVRVALFIDWLSSSISDLSKITLLSKFSPVTTQSAKTRKHTKNIKKRQMKSTVSTSVYFIAFNSFEWCSPSLKITFFLLQRNVPTNYSSCSEKRNIKKNC